MPAKKVAKKVARKRVVKKTAAPVAEMSEAKREQILNDFHHMCERDEARVLELKVRVPVAHCLRVSLNDSTERLMFFVTEARELSRHEPALNPFDPETMGNRPITDMMNVVRDELLRRFNQGEGATDAY
jgi:hypothetical protein